MQYKMQWVTDYTGGTGLRWLNQPTFFGVSDIGSAYLLGHDLLEHFTMNDGSVEAEVFAAGAMVRVRGSEYFNMISDRDLSGAGIEHVLSTTMNSCVADVLEAVNNQREWDQDHFQHLFNPDSFWNAQAEQLTPMKADIEELFSESMRLAVNNLSRNTSGYDLEFLSENSRSILNFARLGYSMACKQYKAYSTEQMALQYKAITKLVEKALNDSEFLMVENEEYVLSTLPNKSIARLKPRNTELAAFWQGEVGKPFLQAHALD